jgi:DNA-binding GntR family transcriptional regulator
METMKIKKNLDVIVYEKMREGFLKGDYTLGQKIDIDEISEQYEVSRTPVIHAVKRLENEGLMETDRGGRVMIPQYTADKIREIYDVRVMLELYAMKCIYECESPIDFSIMQNFADQCAEGYMSGNIIQASQADLNFHKAIISAARNNCLSDIYNKVQGQCMVVNYLLQKPTEEQYAKSIQEHSELIENLRILELEKSNKILEHHLKRNVKRLLAALV